MIESRPAVNKRRSAGFEFFESSSPINVSSPINDLADRYYQMSLSHHTDWINDIIVCKNSNTSKFNQF